MTDQPTEPTQPGRASPDSVELLQQILSRLHKMEGGLSQHEEWLRRMEQEQRKTHPSAGSADAQAVDEAAEATGGDDIRRLIGALTLERDRANNHLADAQRQIGQYQQELASLRPQVAELKKLATEREQQLATLKAESVKQLGQVRSVHTEAQRQLQDRQQQVQEMQSRLHMIEQQAKVKDQRITELQATVAQAAAKLESAAAQATARAAGAITAENGYRWPTFARVAIFIIAIAGLASAGVTTFLYERGRVGATQTASCTILLPGADTQAIQQCATLAGQTEGIIATPEPLLGRVELTTSARNGLTALQKLDNAAQAIVKALPPTTAVVPKSPTSQPEGQQLVIRLAELQRRRTGLSQRANTQDVHAADLATQYKSLKAERSEIATSLAELAKRIEAAPTVAPAGNITADQVAKAEAADQQLQAELEALRQRDEQLCGRLRVAIDAAAVQFKALRKALATADDDFDKLMKEQHPEEVTSQLQIVRDSLKSWDRAVNDLDAQWQTQQKSLQGNGKSDALAVQALLQKSAQAFITDTTTATTALSRAIEVISQGQDQTTKRLVLRNHLVKQLNPVTTAQEAALTAARSAILADNAELTAIVQRLEALRKQVYLRRTQLVAHLRQQQINELQQDRDKQLAQARQEQTRLAQKSAQIDAELLKLSDAGMVAATSLADRVQSLSEEDNVQQSEIQALQQLVNMYQQYAQQMATMPPPPGPSFTPPRLLAGSTSGPTLTNALLIGSAPVLVSSLLLLIVGLIAASRRSRDTIEEYARSLKDMAGRTNG